MKEERKIFANNNIRLEMDDLANVSGGILDYFGFAYPAPDDSFNGIVVPDRIEDIYTNW